MKLSLIFIALFLVACTSENVKYVPSDELIPVRYTDGPYSVHGFLSSKYDNEGKSTSIRGIIYHKYECPKCPSNYLCNPCSYEYIVLIDPIKEPDPSKIIIINFFKDFDKVNKFKIGQELAMHIKFSSNIEEGKTNQNGYFTYEYI